MRDAHSLIVNTPSVRRSLPWLRLHDTHITRMPYTVCKHAHSIAHSTKQITCIIIAFMRLSSLNCRTFVVKRTPLYPGNIVYWCFTFSACRTLKTTEFTAFRMTNGGNYLQKNCSHSTTQHTTCDSQKTNSRIFQITPPFPMHVVALHIITVTHILWFV